ncbi:hypothetical protein ERO13_A10G080175v2 [Gossypium hirsutum]|nr:hypothetical protein ERO13_A10G080175v2 [Gossypium hirsutum]
MEGLLQAGSSYFYYKNAGFLGQEIGISRNGHSYNPFPED